MNNFQPGDKVLITCNDWFFAPDGANYKAVFGTVKGIFSSEETLGVRTNARSTNWYVEVGNMTIAGCQIHYVIKTNAYNSGGALTWDNAGGETKTFERPCSIYNADSVYELPHHEPYKENV